MPKTIKKNKFNDFLQNNLTYKEYTTLPDILGETRNFTSRFLNRPSMGEVNHWKILAGLLRKNNPEISIEKLYSQFSSETRTTKK